MRGARGIVALLALVALCVFLAGGVVSALGPVSLPPAPGAEEVGGGDAAPTPELAVFTPTPLEDLTDALERPPFSQSRRPAAAPAIAAPAPQRLDAVLTGVILSSDDRVAIVADAADGEPVRLREGDVFLGWTLVEVGVDEVTLERNGRRQRLELTFRGAPQAPQAPSGEAQPAEGQAPAEGERRRRVRRIE